MLQYTSLEEQLETIKENVPTADLGAVDPYFCSSGCGTAISLPDATSIGDSFCEGISTCASTSGASGIYLPNVTRIGNNFCGGNYSCQYVTDITLTNVENIGNNFCSEYYACSRAVVFSTTKLETIGHNFCNGTYTCDNLTNFSSSTLYQIGDGFCAETQACINIVDMIFENLSTIGNGFCEGTNACANAKFEFPSVKYIGDGFCSGHEGCGNNSQLNFPSTEYVGEYFCSSINNTPSCDVTVVNLSSATHVGNYFLRGDGLFTQAGPVATIDLRSLTGSIFGFCEFLCLRNVTVYLPFGGSSAICSTVLGGGTWTRSAGAGNAYDICKRNGASW